MRRVIVLPLYSFYIRLAAHPRDILELYMPTILHSILAMCVIFLMAQPVAAQSKKEIAAQGQFMMERIERLEGRMLTGDPAAERLMQRMDALEENMRTLTGEVERLRFERDQLRAEIQGIGNTIASLEGLAALATRMQNHLDAADTAARDQFAGQSFSSPYSATVTGEPYFAPSDGTVSMQPNSASPAPSFAEQVIAAQQFSGGTNLEDLPLAGKTKLAEGDFAGAQTAFRQYLDINPAAPDSGEVSYWLGESYFVRGGYADAADAYISSMRLDPQGVMAPKAMVGLAATMRELGKKTEACSALGSLTSQYPNASAEVREKARLESARTGC